MAAPAFSDIAKPANDVINKDFYHAAAAAFELKLKAPDGLAINAKGTSPHSGAISSSFEAKKVIAKGTGIVRTVKLQHLPNELLRCMTMTGFWYQWKRPIARGWITVTETLTSANIINTKVELENTFADGLKAEFLSAFSAKDGAKPHKLSLYFKQGPAHVRGFFTYNPASGNVDATADVSVAHQGFVVGGEAGYDLQKAAVTRYAAALGYTTPLYSGALTASNNLSVLAASYYHRVNASTEAGVKATYDTKTSSAVGMEIASKYKIDPASFAKAKINDRGLLSLAYNTKINQGFTFGIGVSLDTQKLNEASHKIGTSFTFEG